MELKQKIKEKDEAIISKNLMIEIKGLKKNIW